MDDLINDFLAETREMLQALAGAIVAWEGAPDNRERLDEIFRFVHTVKGNSGFFDLPRLRHLSHAAEDALAEVRSGARVPDPALVTAVLAVIDRIGELVQALETGEAIASEDDEALIAALKADAEAARAPAVLAEPRTAGAEPRRPSRSIRLPVELLDRMMSEVSDAVLARNELGLRLRTGERDMAVEAAFDRLSACIGDIREAITRTRMQRIDSLLSALPRMVRDLAQDLGKQVRLEMDGGDVELDREMIEMIRDPLTHVIRNAIDHGIEPKEERDKAGKPAEGRLRVSARQAGNQILIEVADDGRGIDGEALVRKALAAGIVSAERAEALSAAQKLALAFSPGLSTAGKVTEISGRGVGMDVVHANIERIGGVVDLDSRRGEGVRLSIRVPLTLTIIPALTVTSGGQMFAIPRSAIEEILRAESVEISVAGTARFARLRDRCLPLLSLGALIGGEVQASEIRIILLKPAGGETYALAVDGVCDHEELVVKPAAPAIMAAGLYAGTTLADDGRPILLLDPSGIAALSSLESGLRDTIVPPPREERPSQQARSFLLFRTFANALRAVPVSAVERIIDVEAAAISHIGGRLRVALDGAILPLAGIEEVPEGRVRILRIVDGQSALAYAFAEVVDIRACAINMEPAAAPGEIAGVALVDGAPIEILDPHWLFARHGSGNGSDPLACALDLDDPWMQAFLRPLIESQGYRVVGAGEEADIRIAGEGEAAKKGDPTPLVRLRASPEPSGREDDSIFRYDRSALIGALATRGARR